MKTRVMRRIAVTVLGLALMILFTACAGVGGANGNITLSGSITAVSQANHSVTLNVNGQSYTINGLTDQEIQTLQNQVGHIYTIHVAQNSDGSYTIGSGTNPVPGVETPGTEETPGTNETPGTAIEPGSISFTGPVQSASSSSIVVKLPSGSTLAMIINAQSSESDFNGAQPNAGQMVKVEATAQTDGSFVATSLKPADSGDTTNSVEFKGVTTQAVGSDSILHFTVGNRSFSYAIGSGADLSDFSGNASSIASSTQVKVEVQFNGTTGTIVKVSNQNS